MKKILVMMSTYNGENYLRVQLDSIYAQEGVDVSVLVRDDGSTDATPAILDAYKTSKGLVWYTGENLRATGSFIHLLMHAEQTYDYYAFCDQDDYWQADKLVSAVTMLETVAADAPALYYSGQILVDKELQFIHNHDVDTTRNVKGCYIFPQMAGCTAVFNKVMLQRVQTVSSVDVIFHDTFLFRLCAAMGGHILTESRGHILYRQHGNNVVGLDYSFKGKLAMVKKHVQSQTLYVDTAEILKNYDQFVDAAWKPYLDTVLKSKKSLTAKMQLLFEKGFAFGDKKMRGVFFLKALFG